MMAKGILCCSIYYHTVFKLLYIQQAGAENTPGKIFYVGFARVMDYISTKGLNNVSNFSHHPEALYQLKYVVISYL